MGGSLSQRLIATYTSDFSSGVDSWAANTVQGSLTLVGNQDSVGSENDWLKGTFDTDQTDGLSGIIRPDTFDDIQLGDQFSVTLKLRIISGSDHWDGSDVVSTQFLPAGGDNWAALGFLGTGFQAVQDGTTAHDSGIIPIGVVYDYGDLQPQLRWSLPGDKPKAGAVFYVKDIVIKQYRTS